MKTIAEIVAEIQHQQEMQLESSIYNKILLEYAEDLMMHYASENARAAALELENQKLYQALLYVENRTRNYPYASRVVEQIVMDTLREDYPK